MINDYRDNFLKGIKKSIESGVEGTTNVFFESDTNTIIIYDKITGEFDYNQLDLNGFIANKKDKRSFWKILVDEKYGNKEIAAKIKKDFEKIVNKVTSEVIVDEYYLKNKDNIWGWYMVKLVNTKEKITFVITNVSNYVANSLLLDKIASYDELTGLTNYKTFCIMVEEDINAKTLKKKKEFGILYFDIIQFKALNDMYGKEKGDALLVYIANYISDVANNCGVACHITSDVFALYIKKNKEDVLDIASKINEYIGKFDSKFEVSTNIGIYINDNTPRSCEQMIECASLAQKLIKGSYTIEYNVFNLDMQQALIKEQDLVGKMSQALADGMFKAYYQPQYNHSTGMLIGAEALVRWEHPERGLIAPGIFIPLFEKNGFVTSIDLFVFEEVCKFLRKCIFEKKNIVPISVNISRNDLFQVDFIERLEVIRNNYEIPVKFLRVEITESAIMGNNTFINDFVKKLHNYGYIVEMDDFGSGYSSLNVLKDIDLDIIKLDMKFLHEESENKRGGTIVSAVVRMAKWLELPIIAEGVETTEQANFLKSIGCNFIQGYLYSKPIKQNEFYDLLSKQEVVHPEDNDNIYLDTINANTFWDPESLETLIFSNYIGPACIFDYNDGRIEILRVNKKYLSELAMNLTEKDIIKMDLLTTLDEENQQIFLDMIHRAIKSLDEEECENKRIIHSDCCGDETLYFKTNVRVIGKNNDSTLFYATIKNITKEKEYIERIKSYEEKFVNVTEQVNIYYWEYEIATHIMRPCFRCKRDLGLPEIVYNYPEPAIKDGIFPPEIADEYRNWMKQIDNGLETIEGVLPLTMNRVPFRVKYVTKFDEYGRPVKAIGSATLIVD